MRAPAGPILISEAAPSDTDAADGGACDVPIAECRQLLERTFGTRFTILDGLTGEVLSAGDGQPAVDWDLRAEVCREVARRGRPELIDEEDPFLVLALPLSGAGGNTVVAAATFLSRPVDFGEDLSGPAARLGMDPEQAAEWASRQACWSADALCRVGELVLAQSAVRQRAQALEEETENLSAHLSDTYEEISLLYRLTQNLKISERDEDLGRLALEWMAGVLPAKGLALQLIPAAEDGQSLTHEARAEPVLLTHGDCPVDNRQFTQLIDYFGPGAASRPAVANHPITEQRGWPCAPVRQMLAVSLAEGENLFGWLAALNHLEDGEFGTVEASLLSSVAAILGIHSGNIELYRQQSELLAGIIRALTSAIDAKDPYTCGHSDRVARVAVRLAEELGCDAGTLNTIYLSGLLHDIGKIGINDSVLRKPGKLSQQEYEHIKKHVEIGHKILRDLGKLDEVLPVILHHHESWDGLGYPHQLHAQAIPLAARIVAVADAYDAMGSDRPYRKGMPEGKIDAIFSAGSGEQWDPGVIEAFFSAREDLRKIAHDEQENVDVALQQRT